MRHEHATHAPIKLLEIRKTATSPDLVFQYTPEAFNRIEMVTASDWQELHPKAPLPMRERRGKPVRPGEPTVIDALQLLFSVVGIEEADLMATLPKPPRVICR